MLNRANYAWVCFDQFVHNHNWAEQYAMTLDNEVGRKGRKQKEKKNRKATWRPKLQASPMAKTKHLSELWDP